MFARTAALRSILRHASTMTRMPPREPLLAIIGTTGTGKSDLAVDLAIKHNGEIINADAMQMYRGLPIITNQTSVEEQRGIPHHLLATINFNEPTWTVGVFVRNATTLIREIRSRGKLPIIVGGTHYYINSLLFDHLLVDDPDSLEGHDSYQPQTELEDRFPILKGPTDLMLERLREVDPAIASRWHPDERRKIKRSLEIFLTTGKKASDIYAHQQERKAEIAHQTAHWETLLFWVHCERATLNQRLETRVDQMEKRGLVDEVRRLHEYLIKQKSAGMDVDRTRGIWQSIGYKQFELYLQAEGNNNNSDSLAHMKQTSMDETKIATRQYARQQLKWLRTKLARELHDLGALKYLYLLDSSDPNEFPRDVLSPASRITQAFLDGSTLPEPKGISVAAKDILSAIDTEIMTPKTSFMSQTCDVCNTTVVTEDQWDKHIHSRRHRTRLRNARKGTVSASRAAKLETKHLDLSLGGSTSRD